ncbi:bifunctional [glutamate--ammonia ligase]-adenylyl-L-tyrosine phosphorylase/[glutamate--ammonia-ligase] adenylyltransferase [Curvibacter sp. APW13]|uniref:bifunctional [glutamate--ammonia ligase]-adenylyl-L-tyrosine phosphorylase/[glutamate--ammonia-ligase] adenylyltransferase n=1 Tax=Curvibacter sp. APW13 TaxID=3077236 RepID=UPI0028DF8032|nr:bifunctional [glutamate--ammonia ligase]-adenylyl-L-tyrosine phosphorylase/[glutamate--ammonia-ligase] adenylyltransferase [Curvibacter sp. APW13]MDT8990127.1 bifunctional [glutamate--ammonia ligase]-adenylyl-L-tyrosine phosphorylase/[glutamate--ammonia-ligase] adenylyltransferase [Curvibacter sp. APW13]
MTRNTQPDPAQGSRFAQRVRRRYSEQLALLAPGVPDRAAMQQTFDALRGRGNDTATALRTTRHLVMERLVSLDCSQQASLADVTTTVTLLAEFALDQAWQESESLLREAHGIPMTEQGVPAQLCIVGMGKFGARELNVSSDIDLIYVYDHDGQTTGDATGRRRISNQEYFGKMVRAIYALVGDTTDHGFVFRVDLALRPNGNSGPAAISLGGLEEYFHVQGREWERFAWLKSRVVAPESAKASQCAQSMRQAIIPFVFRRYLDYNVFDSLRVLHRQIRDHAAQRSAGHPERANDVKLSRGGIREIEFTVQLLQVVRGGQFPELRTRPTLSALQRLTAANLMPAATSQALAKAYELLRRLEHRIQYLDDQQTHVLPTDDADLAWIADTLGFADTAAFLCELTTVRELVAQEFDALLGGPQKECQGCQTNTTPSLPGSSDFDALLQQLDGRLRERVAAWRDNPRMLALREGSRNKLARLLQRTGQWMAQGRVSEEGALRFADWMEPLLRRESYLALLLERPVVHERLLDMLAAARWPARYLLKHPGVIDELAGNAILEERFDPAEFERELEFRRQSLAGGGQDDDESLLNLLRRAHHAEVFRTLARDVEGRLSVEQVADDLSALADCVLRITTRWCWCKLKQRHQDEASFGIIAYGKLGGKELGYGSDLDLVFVYDDPHENAAEIYAALVRKLINWLTVKTGEGDLYEIDTALRPNGGSGLLVTSFEAYANYQQQRGSNTAWTWEHQAMTRARCVLGDASLQQRFEQVRQSVIATTRDRDALRQEIASMRDKMRAGNAVPPEQFDVKHSPGGMVDVEFAVQFLVLGWGGEHPELLANAGNIALLQRAERCGLLPAPLGTQAADAYRSLRHIQHQARLNEEPTQRAYDSVQVERDAGLALWQHLFHP